MRILFYKSTKKNKKQIYLYSNFRNLVVYIFSFYMPCPFSTWAIMTPHNSPSPVDLSTVSPLLLRVISAFLFFSVVLSTEEEPRLC